MINCSFFLSSRTELICLISAIFRFNHLYFNSFRFYSWRVNKQFDGKQTPCVDLFIDIVLVTIINIVLFFVVLAINIKHSQNASEIC